MKKVLILTYYWPPGSGPGVQRWLKFCKYLPKLGWQPTVITVKNGSYPYTDQTLESDVPDSVKVIKTSTFEPFALYNFLRGKQGKTVEVGMGSIKSNQGIFTRAANYIRANYFVPDARVGWNKYALTAAENEIKNQKPDVIITTGPPHSTHLVGKRLKDEYGIKWVADFRDPWTTIYYNQFLNRTDTSKKRDRALEDSVVKTCDLMIAATPGLMEEFQSRSQQIVCIPNGFDEADFNQSEATKDDEIIRLSYIGNFKFNQNIPSLWRAVGECIAELPEAANFKLCFTGNVNEKVKNDIAKHGIESHVEYKPFVQHRQAVSLMQNSDALMLPIPLTDGNKLILTGKIFEYLASRRPILGIGPVEGNAADILSNVGHHPMIDYSDVNEMKSFLISVIKSASETKLFQQAGNTDYKNYSREGLAERLAHTLDSTISK